MTSLMRYLLDPQFVVMALAAIAAFATITSFVLPLLSGDRLGSRMNMWPASGSACAHSTWRTWPRGGHTGEN